MQVEQAKQIASKAIEELVAALEASPLFLHRSPGRIDGCRARSPMPFDCAENLFAAASIFELVRPATLGVFALPCPSSSRRPHERVARPVRCSSQASFSTAIPLARALSSSSSGQVEGSASDSDIRFRSFPNAGSDSFVHDLHPPSLGTRFGLIPARLQRRGLCFPGSSRTAQFPPRKRPLTLGAEASRSVGCPHYEGRKWRSKKCTYMLSGIGLGCGSVADASAIKACLGFCRLLPERRHATP